MDTKELAESVKRLRHEYSKHGKTVVNVPETINALVQLVGEMNYHLITARTVAVNVAAELVRCDDMPSSYPEDYERKLPRWILRQIEDSRDFAVGRGHRIKKGCYEEIAECQKKAEPIAELAKEKV